MKPGSQPIVKKPSPAEFVKNKAAEEPQPEDFKDIPPADIVDADVPADIFYNSQDVGGPSATPKIDNELEYAAELTQADKIEAACARVHPKVRAFIEDELRGRFVAVQKLAR